MDVTFNSHILQNNMAVTISEKRGHAFQDEQGGVYGWGLEKEREGRNNVIKLQS